MITLEMMRATLQAVVPCHDNTRNDACDSSGYHTCAIRKTETHEMVCFGRGSEGQKVVPLEGGWKYVSAGWKHTCALQADSSLYCWGDNRFGQATIPTAPPQGWRTVASG